MSFLLPRLQDDLPEAAGIVQTPSVMEGHIAASKSRAEGDEGGVTCEAELRLTQFGSARRHEAFMYRLVGECKSGKSVPSEGERGMRIQSH
jgi:hypothetical protein